MMAAPQQPVLDGPITPVQRRALFAAAKGHGLDIDDLRAMTPAGSISALSRSEAFAVLDRVNSGTAYDERRRRRQRGPRRPKGVFAMVTAAQSAKIEALRLDLAWSPEGLAGFLAERHYSHGGPMSKILTTADASAVIELLKSVIKRQAAARSRGGRGEGGRRSAAATDANTASNEGRLEGHSIAARAAFEGP